MLCISLALEVVSIGQYCPVVFLLTRHSVFVMRELVFWTGVLNECLYLLVDENVAKDKKQTMVGFALFLFVVGMKGKTVMIRAQMDHRCFTNKRKRKK